MCQSRARDVCTQKCVVEESLEPDPTVAGAPGLRRLVLCLWVRKGSMGQEVSEEKPRLACREMNGSTLCLQGSLERLRLPW